MAKSKREDGGREERPSPSLSIHFVNTPLVTAGTSSSAAKRAVAANPLENFLLGVSPPASKSYATSVKPLPTNHRTKRMALSESDDDDPGTTATPVDVSQLNAHKIIHLLGAHTHTCKGGWPRTTDVHCWYCAEPFNTIPIMIPGRLCRRSKRLMDCYGTFCSFDCAKYYVQHTARHDRGNQMSLLAYLHKLTTGRVASIAPLNPRDPKDVAPTFQALIKFGGYMTIDEFRASRKTLPPNDSERGAVTEIVQLMEKKCVPIVQTILHTQTDVLVTNSLREATVRSGVRDRTRPLPGSEALSSQMGLTVRKTSRNDAGTR